MFLRSRDSSSNISGVGKYGLHGNAEVHDLHALAHGRERSKYEALCAPLCKISMPVLAVLAIAALPGIGVNADREYGRAAATVQKRATT